jgi:hypothetical protein
MYMYMVIARLNVRGSCRKLLIRRVTGGSNYHPMLSARLNSPLRRSIAQENIARYAQMARQAITNPPMDQILSPRWANGVRAGGAQ